MRFKKVLLFAASLAFAVSSFTPLAAATALPSAASLVNAAKGPNGKLNLTALVKAITNASSDPVQRVELAKAVALAAVQLADTDPSSAALMIKAATSVVTSNSFTSAAPAAAAVANAAIAVAKNPAVLANTEARNAIDDSVVHAAQIAKGLRTIDPVAAASIAQGARTAALGVDTARGQTTNPLTRLVTSLTQSFNTNQAAGDASESGRGT